MSTKVTVELPDGLYKRTQRFAQLHQQDMDEAISTLLERALSADQREKVADWSEPDPAVEQEMRAYIAMHPKIKERYAGKYVAVYQGELVDHDDDAATLLARVEAQYPDTFVWMTQVGAEPIRTYSVRSPRILRDDG